MKCRDLMHTDLQWVPSTANARDVARIMRDRSLGFLLVIGASTRELGGVVTDRDLAIRVCTEDRRSEEVKVIDIATTTVIMCTEDQPLSEAEQTMRQEQKSRLVVVNNAGIPVGILSLTDILFGDRLGRAIKTTRDVLTREAEGPHSPPEDIKLTPSTPEDEEAASHLGSVTIHRTRAASIKEFP